MNELLKKLTEAVGVSSDEKEVRHLVRDEIRDHADEWHIDAMGNLIAFKKGDGSQSLRVMVDAHMDEVGFMITAIDGDGTFQFTPVGGFDDRSLLGKTVQVGRERIPGVIGAKPVHMTSARERQKISPRSGMRIDIGATSKDNASSKVSVGDYATFLTAYEEIGTHALGKAFDDRAGCAIGIELLKQERFPFDLFVAFTVQEEVGLRGAEAATYGIRPDVALALDCTPALDLPTKMDESPNVSLGKGAAIYVMDRITIQDPRLVSHIMQTADRHNLPFQIRRPGGGGTDTGAIQRQLGGITAATISVPGRYLHAPTSMISLTDYKNTRDLVAATLRGLTTELIRRS